MLENPNNTVRKILFFSLGSVFSQIKSNACCINYLIQISSEAINLLFHYRSNRSSILLLVIMVLFFVLRGTNGTKLRATLHVHATRRVRPDLSANSCS